MFCREIGTNWTSIAFTVLVNLSRSASGRLTHSITFGSYSVMVYKFPDCTSLPFAMYERTVEHMNYNTYLP